MQRRDAREAFKACGQITRQPLHTLHLNESPPAPVSLNSCCVFRPPLVDFVPPPLVSDRVRDIFAQPVNIGCSRKLSNLMGDGDGGVGRRWTIPPLGFPNSPR